MRNRSRIFIAATAFVVAGLVAGALVEIWVRLQWNEKKGAPGFYVSDPVVGQRLSPGYDGWFAGVPVTINALGFRDDREYDIQKAPGTFRILVLGDSVTFGHGTLQHTTYPYLLEQRLKAWRPDVKWEVWNLGVPGYNTTHELSYLKEVGPRYEPDLVIVGVYQNDISNNETPDQPSAVKRIRSAIQAELRRRLYSYEFYKRAMLTVQWRLFADVGDRLLLESLASENELLAMGADPSQNPQQQLTAVERFDDQQVHDFACPGTPAPTGRTGADDLRDRIRARAPDVAPWLDSVHALQALGRQGAYRLMFFINMAPYRCIGFDRFFDVGTLADEALLLDVLGDGVPAVSVASEFMHYRPSQMPGASGHSVGNANRVKADVLFEFLRSSVLPPLLPVAQTPAGEK